MKKFVSVCLVLLLTTLNLPAYDIFNVDGANYSYVFDIYKSGEQSQVIDEDDQYMKGVFNILSSYRAPLFAAGKYWASLINSSATDPVSYLVISENDYNAAAFSPYIRVDEKDYKVTRVNAKINGLTPAEDQDDDDDHNLDRNGLVVIGLGISEEHPGWGTSTGYHGLSHSDLPELLPVFRGRRNTKSARRRCQCRYRKK